MNILWLQEHKEKYKIMTQETFQEDYTKQLEVKVNTLNSLLPQNAPFVIAQVSEAVKMLYGETFVTASRNLDMAIRIAEQINKFSQGDLLYNYRPIILALLQDMVNPKLDVFDTVNHEIPVNFSVIQQFVDTYAVETKTAAGKIVEFYTQGKSDVYTVILARMLSDIAEGKNVVNIAYIITNLNMAKVQFANEPFQFYVDILTEINKANF